MPGIRLRHPVARNCTYVVEAMHRPYRTPVPCHVQGCRPRHTVKTYHLTLDDQGSVIVSETIYRRLLEVPGLGGLELENEVRKPPPITLAVPTLEFRGRVFAPGAQAQPPPLVREGR